MEDGLAGDRCLGGREGDGEMGMEKDGTGQTRKGSEGHGNGKKERIADETIARGTDVVM